MIHEIFSIFKFGNNFELLLSEKELCNVFYMPKIFKSMKFVAYSSTVFKMFISDFKASVPFMDKIPAGNDLKKSCTSKFYNEHALFIGFIWEQLQSSSLPWDYSRNIDNLLAYINIMLENISSSQAEIVTESYHVHVIERINLFPNFRSIVEIFVKSSYQGVPIIEQSVGVITRERQNDCNLPLNNVFKKLLDFGKMYVAAIRDNITSRFDCATLTICRKFQMIFDTTPYFYPSNMHSNGDPFFSIDTFSKFPADIPFGSKNDQEQKTMLFNFVS